MDTTAPGASQGKFALADQILNHQPRRSTNLVERVLGFIIMQRQARFRVLISTLAFLGIFLVYCSQTKSTKGTVPVESASVESVPTDSTESSINAIILGQAEAWNQGDLVRFMSAYWKDDRLTFSSGGETHRGWQVTLDRYRSRYPDKKTMGKLTFSNLETQLLGTDNAMTLGQWQLARDKPVGGNFTLVWKKLDGSWVIIHDHSSSLETKE